MIGVDGVGGRLTAKQEDVDNLAREANKLWWEENKQRFLP
jgi:hypothetical protein